MDDPVAKATQAARESKYIEFKSEFDVASDADWCELIKDMIAIANSGGGAIVIGVDNRGQPTGFDASSILAVDPADVANRIHKYTGTHFSDFDLVSLEKGGHRLAVIMLRAPEYPMVFCKPGCYAVSGGKQKTAFAQGTLYFRHGAKSEPAVTDDLRKFVDRKLEIIRREWLQGVRRVVSGRPGASAATTASGEVRVTSDPAAAGIRIVDDPNAPAYRQVDPNQTHPFRQKDVIAQVKQSLPAGAHFSTRDALAIRRLFDVDNNPAFFYRPRFASPQYSREYVAWLTNQITHDGMFLDDVRRRWSEQNPRG